MPDGYWRTREDGAPFLWPPVVAIRRENDEERDVRTMDPASLEEGWTDDKKRAFKAVWGMMAEALKTNAAHEWLRQEKALGVEVGALSAAFTQAQRYAEFSARKFA